MPAAVTKAKSKSKSKAPPSEGQVVPGASFLSSPNSIQSPSPRLSPFYACGPAVGLSAPVQAEFSSGKEVEEEGEDVSAEPEPQPMPVQQQASEDEEPAEPDRQLPLTQRQTEAENDAVPEVPEVQPMPVQLWDCSEYDKPTCVQTQEAVSQDQVQAECASCEEEPVQHYPAQSRSPRNIRQEARSGLQDANQPLPHGERIQAAFGRHDVSRVRTNIAGSAKNANRRMGALAFTSGNRIGFRGAPSLRLAAHEAAHVVQQREGLSLPDNVGRAGDRWERHADRVADTATGGRSAEALLDEVAEPEASSREGIEGGVDGTPVESSAAVQQQITSGAARLLEPPPVRAEIPETAAEGGGDSAEATAEEMEPGDRGEEDSALEAAEQGDSEAPPEGVSADGGRTAGGGASASAAGAAPSESGGEAPAAGPSASASATGPETATETAAVSGDGGRTPDTPAEASSGGGISGACYSTDPEQRPEEAAEPTSDDRGSEPEEEPQVEFEPWPDEVDTCQATSAGEGQQMPEGIGEGPAVAGGVLAEGGGPVAAPATGDGASAGATATENGGTSGSSEVQAMSGAATKGAEQNMAEAGTMEGPIARGEGERNAAVNDYLASTGGLESARNRSQSLEAGVTFPAAGDREQFDTRQAAMAETQGFMERAADQIADAVAFAQEAVPEMLRVAAESAKADIQGAIETEKAAISGRIAQVRGQARASAAAARAHVNAEYDSSAAVIESVTSAAISALDAKHSASVALVDENETSGLDDVNSRFAAGRTQHEAKGPEYAALAIARGQEHADAYEHCKGDYSDDGFWDGCLTVRRARAQQDTACKTAAGYRDVFLRTANKKGYDLRPLRTQYRCAVIEGARQVNQTLDDTHVQLVSGLESGRIQALDGIALARDENLAAIDNALSSTLKSLAAQEFSQRQAVNDTGYLKQLAVEQLAHSGAAGLARGISAAMDSLEQTLTMLRGRFAEGDIPEPASLAQSLSVTETALGGGMGTLLETMEEGARQAEDGITGLGAAAFQALGLLTAKNDELSAQAEGSFAQQMGALQAGASAIFGQLTENHVQQAQQAMTDGTASMDQAVAGFDEALATIGGRVDEAIATSLQELDGDLSSKLGELDGQITREAWKAAEKEQPAWKSVVAIVLIILVIIAAAVISIVTLGAGASLFAVILVGALVGAVSGGLIQLINNWASGEAWHQGLAQAMIMGAIGGALGGGVGFAGGALSAAAGAAGARVVTQVAITVGSDLVAEAATQAVGYVAFGQEFNWQGFVMAGAMSGVSFRATRPGGSTAAAGAAGGRRAAVTQVAGGAALGLGIEAGTAYLSGQEFDLTRAASAAASGAVGARMARRGGPAGPRREPTTRLGRTAQRFRSFDPGGVGARLETRLQGLGGRIGGTRPGAEPAAGGRPRTTEEPATTRPLEEGLSPRSRTDAGSEQTTPRSDAEVNTNAARSRSGPTPGTDLDMPAKTVSDADLAATTTNSSRVGDVDHFNAVRKPVSRVECEVCSFGCGRIISRIDEIETRLRELDPDHPLVEGLQRLREDVTRVEEGIENASMSHRDAINESAQIAQRFRELGEIEPRLGEALNQPARILPEGGTSHGRVQIEDLGVELGTRQVKSIERFGEIDIPDQTPVLYVLRDVDTGAVMKVGQTTMGSGSDARFGRYHRAGSELGVRVELEVTPVSNLRGLDIETPEGRLRAALEDQGHVMPWDYTQPHRYRDVRGVGTRGRLGREGPGTPFESLPGSASSRVRREGYEWERGEVPSKGYLQPPSEHTGVKPTTPVEQTAEVLMANPNATRAEQARSLGITPGQLRWRLREWRSQLRDLGASI